MDWQILILGIGLLISLVLGVINLLARREKVVVVNSIVDPQFLPKGTRLDTKLGMGPLGMEPLFISNAALTIEASCYLVLTRGQQEIEVNEVEVKFDRATSDELKNYFQIPRRNRIFLYAEPEITINASLPIKKPVKFGGERLFDCTEEFQKQYERMEHGSYPDFIHPLLDKLATKYQISWTRYDGKELSWKFPQKWWSNLGKRFWG